MVQYIEWSEDLMLMRKLISSTILGIQKGQWNASMELLAYTLHLMYGSTSITKLIERSSETCMESVLFNEKMNEVIKINNWKKSTSRVIFYNLKRILKNTTINRGFLNKICLQYTNTVPKNSPEWCLPSKFKKLPSNNNTKIWLINCIKKCHTHTSYKSQVTIKQFLAYIIKILDKLGIRVDDVSEINSTHIFECVTLTKLKKVINSVKSCLSEKNKILYIISFFKKILQLEHIDMTELLEWKECSTSTPSSSMEIKPDHDTHRISNIELQKMYEESSKNIRDELMFMLLITTGMRVGGLSNIKLSHVCDMLGNEIIVKNIGRTLEKGNKWFSFQINERTKKLIHFWIENHRKSMGEYLIPGRGTDAGMCPNRIGKIIKDIGKRSGVVGTHVHPHSLRHSFAHILLEYGNDIPLISKMLGHSTSQTTESYYLIESAADASKRANIPWLNNNRDDEGTYGVPSFLAQYLQPPQPIVTKKSKSDKRLELTRMRDDFKSI
jgi:site-specific recombinase XerD